MPIENTLRAVKHFLWPSRCAACDVLLEVQKQCLCQDCRGSLRLCHAISPPSSIDSACAFFIYEGAIQECIAKWKFHEDFCAQQALLSLCAEFAPQILPPPLPGSLIISVPPHPKRLSQRGFDPAWTFARELQKLFQSIHKQELIHDEHCLQRTRHTPHQAFLSDEERQKNLAVAFECTRSISQPVVLVDDVFTTGATANACAQILVKAGATSILFVGLAYTTK